MIINFKRYHWQLNNKIVYSIFLLFWLVLNLLQAYFTQLHYDEAYYWVYSRHLAWGYFDHPPVVALLIKLGYSIFHNELGVRLFFVILGTATTGLILYLINETEDLFFVFIYLLAVPLMHLHVGGFLALPDTPMIFFATLFFIIYRRFLKNETVLNAILLGIVAAAMLYSKYHGILIIGFTLLSNLKLLGKWKTWIIGFTILLLMIPHVWWQYINKFPTIQYEILGRLEAVRYMQPLNFIIGQLFVPGVLTGVVLIYFVFIYKPVDNFEKALKWNIFCFYIFFILFSFRTNTQAHWTAAIIPPIIILSYKSIKLSKYNIKKWFVPLAAFGIIGLFIVRFIIANDSLADKIPTSIGFNDWKKMTHRVDRVAKGHGVLFESSYKRASVYAFYSGKLPVTAPQIGYRFSQFDLLHNEDKLNKQDVIFMDTRDRTDYHIIGEHSIILNYRLVPNYIAYHHYLSISYFAGDVNAQKGEIKTFPIIIKNISNDSLVFPENIDLKPSITYNIAGLYSIDKHKEFSFLSNKKSIDPGDTLIMNMKVRMPTVRGKYVMRFFITHGYHFRCVTGDAIKIKIE